MLAALRTRMARLVPHARVALVLAAGVLLAPAPAVGLHRPRRRLRADVVVPVVLVTMIVVVGLAPGLAVPRAVAASSAAPAPPQAAIKRLIVRRLRRPGPEAHRQFMKEGMLPNFSDAGRSRAATAGCRRPIPSLSPVAWSSFSTGAHPGAPQHLRLPRSRPAHLPADAVVHAHRQGRAVPEDRQVPRFRSSKPELRLLRQSKPFWTILGEHRIWSTVLRVPITFPPDRFYGARAERDVRARSARHAGHVPALHHAARRATRFKEGGHPRAGRRSPATRIDHA